MTTVFDYIERRSFIHRMTGASKLALLLLCCGLILDTVAKKHRQQFEINLNMLNLLHRKDPA